MKPGSVYFVCDLMLLLLQMSLHEGCEKILVSDSVHLADRMYKTQKRGINCHRKYINVMTGMVSY